MAGSRGEPEVMEEMRNGYHHARAQYKKGLKVRINSEVNRAVFLTRGTWGLVGSYPQTSRGSFSAVSKPMFCK